MSVLRLTPNYTPLQCLRCPCYDRILWSWASPPQKWNRALLLWGWKSQYYYEPWFFRRWRKAGRWREMRHQTCCSPPPSPLNQQLDLVHVSQQLEFWEELFGYFWARLNIPICDSGGKLVKVILQFHTLWINATKRYRKHYSSQHLAWALSLFILALALFNESIGTGHSSLTSMWHALITSMH